MRVGVHFNFLPIPEDHRRQISPQSIMTLLLRIQEKITNEMCCETLTKHRQGAKRFVRTCENKVYFCSQKQTNIS